MKEKVDFFPNKNILDRSKLKAFVDSISDVDKRMITVFDTAETIVGKGEMLVNSIFSFSRNVL